ncbi:hypothetical protein [Nafulsella turpanensis]|uniref:hypothetical protein n=1 Tax=Nafulsella turpanensis TaxID=1265690 RepID=UPI0003751217|nr:hypothetical protein [Nafulsella turpanensis]
MKVKNNYTGFIFAIVFLALGIGMISQDMVAIGVNSRTHSLSGFGGSLLIFVGIIFLVVGYYGLSPFSHLRRIIEKSQ